MLNSPRTFTVETLTLDELDSPPSVTPADQQRMTERLSVASPVPHLLRDALDEESETKGLARTMLRVTHRLTRWERNGQVIIGGQS